MKVSSVGVFAAGAGAIMIPPGLSFKPGNPHHGSSTLNVDPFTQLLEVPCPGCAYTQPSEQGLVWTKGVENSLFLNVSVGSKPDTLELDGVQFYPPLLPLTAEVEPIYIVQAAKKTPMNEIRAHADKFAKLRLTSWSFLAEDVRKVDSGEEIITIRLSLKALELQPIEIDDIIITGLKNSKAQMMLLKTETQARPASPHSSTKECQHFPLLCQWRAILAEKLDKVRGKFKGKCNKHKHAQGHGRHGHKDIKGNKHEEHQSEKAEQDGEHKRPHPHHHGKKPHHNGKKPHHQGQHKGMHMHHEKLHKVARFMLKVVIPLLIGVLVGMITYLVGMLVGTALALVWARFRGRGGRYQAIALEEGDEVVLVYDEHVSEKEVVPAEQYVDAPPQYIEVQIDDEKEVTQE
jgi:hypothetical protein